MLWERGSIHFNSGSLYVANSPLIARVRDKAQENNCYNSLHKKGKLIISQLLFFWSSYASSDQVWHTAMSVCRSSSSVASEIPLTCPKTQLPPDNPSWPAVNQWREGNSEETQVCKSHGSSQLSLWKGWSAFWDNPLGNSWWSWKGLLLACIRSILETILRS